MEFRPPLHLTIHVETAFGRLGQDSLASKIEKGRKELCSLLKQNLDVFAWKPVDMTGVPRNIAEHRLNIREGLTPNQAKRKEDQAPTEIKFPRREATLKKKSTETLTENIQNPSTAKHEIEPKECSLRNGRRNVLRLQSKHQRVESMSEKADAVLSLPSPRCIKDVQKLNGKLASLNRFK
ncbi:hypothetical protein Tco_0014052 [Tanacetum coccineum]